MEFIASPAKSEQVYNSSLVSLSGSSFVFAIFVSAFQIDGIARFEYIFDCSPDLLDKRLSTAWQKASIAVETVTPIGIE